MTTLLGFVCTRLCGLRATSHHRRGRNFRKTSFGGYRYDQTTRCQRHYLGSRADRRESDHRLHAARQQGEHQRGRRRSRRQRRRREPLTQEDIRSNEVRQGKHRRAYVLYGHTIRTQRTWPVLFFYLLQIHKYICGFADFAIDTDCRYDKIFLGNEPSLSVAPSRKNQKSRNRQIWQAN